MIDEFGRTGRAPAAPASTTTTDGKRTRLWPGLREHFAEATDVDLPLEDMQERMLFAEAIETVRCLDEGVLTSVADANIGSILGIGFPAWTGGVLQYINGYEGGVPGFVARARRARRPLRRAVPAVRRRCGPGRRPRRDRPQPRVRRTANATAARGSPESRWARAPVPRPSTAARSSRARAGRRPPPGPE